MFASITFAITEMDGSLPMSKLWLAVSEAVIRQISTHGLFQTFKCSWRRCTEPFLVPRCSPLMKLSSNWRLHVMRVDAFNSTARQWTKPERETS